MAQGRTFDEGVLRVTIGGTEVAREEFLILQGRSFGRGDGVSTAGYRILPTQANEGHHPVLGRTGPRLAAALGPVWTDRRTGPRNPGPVWSAETHLQTRRSTGRTFREYPGVARELGNRRFAGLPLRASPRHRHGNRPARLAAPGESCGLCLDRPRPRGDRGRHAQAFTAAPGSQRRDRCEASVVRHGWPPHQSRDARPATVGRPRKSIPRSQTGNAVHSLGLPDSGRRSPQPNTFPSPTRPYSS